MGIPSYHLTLAGPSQNKIIFLFTRIGRWVIARVMRHDGNSIIQEKLRRPRLTSVSVVSHNRASAVLFGPAMSKYRKWWTDENGTKHICPGRGKRLRPTERREHAKLRAFVFRRDNFRCVGCGAESRNEIPANYDGRDGICVYPAGSDRLRFLYIDHIKPRNQGGSNHPSNLQALCGSCNASKGTKLDWRGLANND